MLFKEKGTSNIILLVTTYSICLNSCLLNTLKVIGSLLICTIRISLACCLGYYMCHIHLDVNENMVFNIHSNNSLIIDIPSYILKHN